MKLQGWVDADTEGVPAYEEIVGAHDDEDEAYDEQADQFEAAYNFRFEVSSAQSLILLHASISLYHMLSSDTLSNQKRQHAGVPTVMSCCSIADTFLLLQRKTHTP